jgi:hypothetical protein
MFVHVTDSENTPLGKRKTVYDIRFEPNQLQQYNKKKLDFTISAIHTH